MKTNQNSENSADVWLNAAYEVLVQNGVEAVKIMTIAKRIGLTRTGFYWHYKDINALLDALISRWELINTENLISRTQAPASTITQAMLNVFDCWHDDTLFDAPLDLAIRNWARNSAHVQVRLARADQRRIAAITDMFCRFGYKHNLAEVRSLTAIYTQIGYISIPVSDSANERLARVPHYIEVFTGVRPSPAEIAEFEARHKH